MEQLDLFFEKFNGYTEPYYFYNNTVELRYEPKEHVYYKMVDGDFVAQDGVTTICHIIDKSNALIPWGCKMMAQKILATIPASVDESGGKCIRVAYDEFEKIILDSKNAHKEKLNEAAEVGHIAHNWIEKYIQWLIDTNSDIDVNVLPPFPDDERAANCCKAAISWMVAHNVKWICTERKIYSLKHGYAGTMDGLCRVDSCSDKQCCPHEFKDRLSVADWKSSNYLYIEYLFQTAAYEAAYEEEFGVDVEDRWVIRLGKEDGEFDPWHLETHQFQLHFDAFLACLQLSRAVDSVEAEMKVKKDAAKAIKKAKAQAEKEAQLKIKCKAADKYKGVKPPKCNGGNPCLTCQARYAANQAAKRAKRDMRLIRLLKVLDIRY